MKIYAISVSHQTHRQVVLKDYFKNVEFINAIDKVNIKRTNKLKSGEIACFLSHLKVWKIISNNNNDEWVLVLEDDAKPKKDWYNRLEEGIKEVDENYGIIYLGHGKKTTKELWIKRILKKNKNKNTNGFVFHKEKSLGKHTEICNPIYMTHAYLIKPSTAKFLLNSIKIKEHPIDIEWWLYGIKFAKFKKALIVQNRIFETTIQGREKGW